MKEYRIGFETGRLTALSLDLYIPYVLFILPYTISSSLVSWSERKSKTKKFNFFPNLFLSIFLSTKTEHYQKAVLSSKHEEVQQVNAPLVFHL
jgi:hypothetical protein